MQKNPSTHFMLKGTLLSNTGTEALKFINMFKLLQGFFNQCTPLLQLLLQENNSSFLKGDHSNGAYRIQNRLFDVHINGPHACE